ncbi:MAG TPA: Gfo/Idh/MocA family oxidoreductase [Armatimonadetes bacterium]|nr:Gfo/Idh/MocA family oxidoreductase [Armatimonadota bacterium]
MQEKVGIGIIGCGHMARTHARILAHLPEAYLRGFADLREEAAQRLRAEVDGEYATTDVARLLEDEGIDVVLICTHHDSHRPLCIQAAQAGKHVFVEKPLTLSIEDCQEVERAVEGAGVKLMVGFQARFSPFSQKLKEVIPRPLVTVGQLVDPRWGDEIWANDPVEGGGNVLSQGCHAFDLVCWFNDSEPVTIYAEGGNFTHPQLPITDSVVATIRFANGSVASVIIGDFGANPFTGKAFYELFDGTKTGTMYGYYSEPALRFWGTDLETYTVADLPPERRDRWGAHGYVDMMRALLAWVGRDVDPVVAAQAKEGTRATALGVKAIEAIKTGQPQAL